MGILTVAEWVENDATLSALKGMDVDFVQGRGIAAEQLWADARAEAGFERAVRGAGSR